MKISWFVRHANLIGMLLLPMLLASVVFGTGLVWPTAITFAARAWQGQFRSYRDFARYISSTHKAPFQAVTPVSVQQWQAFRKTQQQSKPIVNVAIGRNTKVNRDLNPWNKLSIAAAVNPADAQNYLVLTNDYRENFSHQYYHVSQTGGRTWHDDALADSVDAATSSPYNLQTNPGVAFDAVGNSFFSMLSANIIADTTTSYSNFDTQIDIVQGYNRGNFSAPTTTTVDYVPCNGILSPTTPFNCAGQLQRPFITVDTQPNSPHRGTIYVYYTYFCNGISLATDTTPTAESLLPCVDGNISIPALTSVILEADSPGPGMPFSKPKQVSAFAQSQAAYPNMVVDAQGVPHIFFEDFSNYPTAQLFESTFQHGKWQMASKPLVDLQYISLGNDAWSFFGNSNPGCSGFRMMIYCAFTANKVNNGPSFVTPSIYLLSLNLKNAAQTVTRVNDDPANDLKTHFFPWASTNSRGEIYVGWYDNRHDPLNLKVEYFVAKSLDQGHSFRHQQAVSDTLFNPCIGSPNCGYFGDYDQLVTGPDDVTHATWIDTRDGASEQIYSQAITW
ncbi:MAG TPA: hypothetical protein VGN34_17690 [Ktedonobacteraceae bacterium]